MRISDWSSDVCSSDLSRLDFSARSRSDSDLPLTHSTGPGPKPRRYGWGIWMARYAPDGAPPSRRSEHWRGITHDRHCRHQIDGATVHSCFGACCGAARLSEHFDLYYSICWRYVPSITDGHGVGKEWV